MNRRHPYRSSGVRPPWRQAEPWRQTREDNWRVIREIVGGIAVLVLVGAAVWIWAAILLAAEATRLRIRSDTSKEDPR